MGLAASQCRLLLLTSRKSDLELKAQNITNKKLLLSMESEEIASEYSRALNEKILMFSYSTDSSNGTSQSVTLTYDVLTSKLNEGLSRQKRLVTEAGEIVAKGYNDPVLRSFLNITVDNKNLPVGYVRPLANQRGDVVGGIVQKLNYNDPTDPCWNYYSEQQKTDLMAAYDSLSAEAKDTLNNTQLPDQGRTVIFLGDDLDNTYLLQNALRMGTLLIEQGAHAKSDEISDETGTKSSTSSLDKPMTWSSLNWQGDAAFIDERDTSAYSRATAIYETKNARLQQQDKRLDMELKQIETQRKACETEIDAVKKVAEDNVTKTFKYFQG